MPLLDAAGVDATVLVQTRSSADESREFLATASSSTTHRRRRRLDGPHEPVRRRRHGRAPLGRRWRPARRHPPPGPRRARPGVAPPPGRPSRPPCRRRRRACPTTCSSGHGRCRRRSRSSGRCRTCASSSTISAKPPIRERDIATWAERIAPFGALPNAWCKLSGLVTEADWSSWTVADLRPAVDHALAVFGPRRLIFGSDWPVCLLAATYQRVIETARRRSSRT